MSEISVDPANLLIGRDWTKGGATTLTVWFYGDPNNNPATSQLYVRFNDTVQRIYADSANLTRARWTQWNIDLTGITNVTKFAVGISKIGGRFGRPYYS